ncbi:MAG: maltose/maltodextrin ABC transporter substrate-binding protein MalE [Candidatus Chloroheliales bacterium]|nr:MAG: maltose/maltodextrin ABC transporter substrate-binding protein MalE [Chloroflexota bacterium]
MRKMFRAMLMLMVASMMLVACGGDTTPTAQPSPTTAAAVQAAPTNTTAAAVMTSTVATAAPTATTAAAAAGPTPTKPKPVASKEGTLTIWVDAGRVPAITELGKQFTAKYNVPVVVQELGFGDIRDDLKLSGPAGEGPDLIIGAHDWLGELVSNGLLEPLDLGAKAASFNPVAVKAFTYNGKLYGMPYSVEAVALMYNKDLVPTPPKTWDELKQIAKQLQDAGKVEQGYVLQQGDPYHTEALNTGFGGYIFGRNADGSYNPQDVGLDSPGAKAAAAELDSMVKQGLLRKDVTADLMNSMFQQGKSAMMITGPWALGDVRKSGIHYGVAKIPTMKQTPRPFVGVQGFMVSAFAKNKLLAKTFLTEYVATDDAMMALYKAVPASMAWLPIKDKINDPDLAVFAASASDGDPMPAIPQMSSVWDSWTKAIVLIFQQQQAPDKAMDDAAKAIRDKIASSK